MRWLLCLAVLMTAGCSNAMIYDSLQTSREQECQQLPPGEYRDCMQDLDPPYEEYERQRTGSVD